jgi:hypothetical protein
MKVRFDRKNEKAIVTTQTAEVKISQSASGQVQIEVTPMASNDLRLDFDTQIGTLEIRSLKR